MAKRMGLLLRLILKLSGKKKGELPTQEEYDEMVKSAEWFKIHQHDEVDINGEKMTLRDLMRKY